MKACSKPGKPTLSGAASPPHADRWLCANFFVGKLVSCSRKREGIAAYPSACFGLECGLEYRLNERQPVSVGFMVFGKGSRRVKGVQRTLKTHAVRNGKPAAR